MGRIVMGYWDCKYCNSKKIPGSSRECPNCGKPRDNETRFYADPIEQAKPVDKKTAEKVRKRGKDWICEYCNSLNNGLDEYCQSCGAQKSNLRYQTQEPKTPVNTEFNKPRHKSQQSYEPEITQGQPETNHPSPSRHGKRIDIKRIALISVSILAAIAVCFLLVGLLTPKDIDIHVTDTSWTYSIDIEEYRTVHESDWTIPTGGRLLYSQSEIHHYTSVVDHYEQRSYEEIDYYEEVVVGYRDLGNGYMEEITSQEPHYKTVYRDEPVYRNEPVYKTKYYYEIERWIHSRTVTTSGHDKLPYWGDTNLSDLEREAHRFEKYKIYGYDNNGKTYECNVDHSTWLSCEIDDQIHGKIDIFGNFTPES